MFSLGLCHLFQLHLCDGSNVTFAFVHFPFQDTKRVVDESTEPLPEFAQDIHGFLLHVVWVTFGAVFADLYIRVCMLLIVGNEVNAGLSAGVTCDKFRAFTDIPRTDKSFAVVAYLVNVPSEHNVNFFAATIFLSLSAMRNDAVVVLIFIPDSFTTRITMVFVVFLGREFAATLETYGLFLPRVQIVSSAAINPLYLELATKSVPVGDTDTTLAFLHSTLASGAEFTIDGCKVSEVVAFLVAADTAGSILRPSKVLWKFFQLL